MLQDVNTEEESDADMVFKSRSKCVASCEPFGMSDRSLVLLTIFCLTASCT